jgi:hypothetical protein
MRRVAELALTLVAALSAASAADAAGRPALRVLDTQPVVLAGVAFSPRERVVVTALDATRSRRVVVRAGARGSFDVTVGLTLPACGRPLTIRAAGSSGSHVTVLLSARRCVPSPIHAPPRIQVPPPMR